MHSVRPKLVILGSGFAAFSLLKHIDTERFSVTVVSPRNYFLFTPLLPSTTVGTVEFRSIIEPIRTARKGVRYHQAECVGIDRDKQKLFCEGVFKRTPFELYYDYLVFAVGGKNNTFGVPGVEQYALFLKELPDARAIRHRVIECFERASKPGRPVEDLQWLLHFVVVGGGPTGVEFAAELHDFVSKDVHKWYPDLMEHVQITLLEAQDAILTAFDQKLSSYAMKHFKRQRINIRTKSMVSKVREDAVVLSDGEEIPCNLVVWSTGIGPQDIVRDIDLPKDRARRLITDGHFRVKEGKNIYAIGDCATIEDEQLPATAQVAQQEGRHLARILNKMVRENEEAQPFRYKHMGMMAYIGQHKALADMKNVKGKGNTAWIFWRSAYLTKLVSNKNKMLVLSDWTRTFFFGRDISQL